VQRPPRQRLRPNAVIVQVGPGTQVSDFTTNQDIGRHCAEGANGSGQLPIGESIQGVCLQEDLSPFVEELATQ
jgi:hypothetical protein